MYTCYIFGNFVLLQKRPSFKKIVRELEDAIEDAKRMQKPPEVYNYSK